MTLSVPAVTPDDDTLSAALKYAAADWYVLPVSPRDRKNPGSRVGKGWQHQSTRDTDQIVAWWAGTSDLLALHCGRSGAVVADVDHSDQIPDPLRRAIDETSPPHQSSRPDQPGRGHYVFAQPPGRMIGNSTGGLGKGWGETRGKNGIIVVTPSLHKDDAAGARYRWEHTGDVPVLPPYVAELLPDANQAVDAATDAEVDRFVATHTTATSPGKLRGPLTKFAQHITEGASRHESLTSVACWAVREAMTGWYSAEAAIDALREAFITAMSTSRDGKERVVTAASATAEAASVIAWAVSQAEFTDPGMHGQNGQNPDGPAGADSSGHFGHAIGEPWETPVPLGWRPQPLPTDALGPVLGPLADAIAEAYQVPADLAVNLGLPLITTAARGRWTVQITPDWSESIAVATLSALASGERKSPVLRTLAEPLTVHERAAVAAARPQLARERAERKVAEDRAGKLLKDAVKGTGTDADYVKACQNLAELPNTPPPRWIVDDITAEAIALRLADHGSIGAISAEPGLFSILAGRYSNGAPNVENVLKATSGDRITVDRVGRDDPIIVEHPTLSIAMCIQPARLAELGGTGKVFRGSGLLARLLYVLPDAMVGTRSISPKSVPVSVTARWADHLGKLLGVAEEIKDAVITVDPGALVLLDDFRTQLEPALHPQHGTLAGIADWGSKLPGTIVRIAAALTLLADPYRLSIDEATMRDAVRLGRAYTSHAQAAFALIHAADDNLANARGVLGWLTKNAQPTFTVREVYRALRGRAWIQTADDLRPVLGVLVDHGHIRRLPDQRQPGEAGRPSEHYQLHPTHLGAQQ